MQRYKAFEFNQAKLNLIQNQQKQANSTNSTNKYTQLSFNSQ